MARTVNKKLAEFISERFNEIMIETGLDLEIFAAYSKIGYSTFRTYHSRTVPISVETLHRICEPFDILLSDFFKANTPLIISEKIKSKASIFAAQYILEKKKIIKEDDIIFHKKPVGSGNKWERDMIKYITLHTDYFHTERSIADMVHDFTKDFDFPLESGRIYELLRKYVGPILKKEPSMRLNNDKTTSNRTVFLYSKI